MHDFLIVGGGVVGLSLAWELSRRDQHVLLVDRQRPGTATSWVGVGILPPPQTLATHDSLEQLRALSHRLHPQWSKQLCDETTIDNELIRCGGLYVARGVGEAVSLRAAMQQAQEYGVRVEELAINDLVRYEPALAEVAQENVKTAFRLPDEMQLRSPRHLQALERACLRNGVEIRANVRVQEIEVAHGKTVSVRTDAGTLGAGSYILATGVWTKPLLEPLGYHVPIEPWRGQVLLWKTTEPLLSHVVNEGFRYLVPRVDGHLLAGATVEDVGFDCETTEEAIAELREFSCSLLPVLRRETVARVWAGLRPGSADGLPYLGWVPGLENLAVAAGHFRSGLHLSPAPAVVMSQLLLGEKPEVDLGPFRLNR